ncbi:hypothetical protein ABZ208_18455 [Streptomyces sp. NPDC006208]|uniref:hypothetical protein n=1 Tax=Streptomyces sp. NPDC006208 TaxID=3156734 RepID=UPI00339F8239
MSMRHMRTMGRVRAAAALSAVLVFSLAACGGGSEDPKPGEAASSPAKNEGDKETSADPVASTPSEPIAVIKGDAGLELSVFSARRDEGGFLTLDGQIKNTGSEGFTVPVQWNGLEQSVASTGRSFAGMTLVDSKGKKRYYVLRDTDNRPLTTYAYGSFIEGGGTLPFFAQFPAPPVDTTTVALQFPGFPSASIELS